MPSELTRLNGYMIAGQRGCPVGRCRQFLRNPSGLCACSTMFVLRTCAPFCEIENQSSCSLGLSHQLLRGTGNGFEEGLVELGDHLHIAFAGESLFVRQQVFHLGRQQWRKTLSHALALQLIVNDLVEHVAVAIDLQPPKVPSRTALLDGRGDRCLDVASVCTSGYKFWWEPVSHQMVNAHFWKTRVQMPHR